ncbi:hypothetical protein R75471_01277 [Paraburkholderia domus]|nr:hypothetical protein R75483_05868 [Paraburkholderia domus]CAE6874691.1 hypothetical protein R75471_01277 [Paraburkholderia domus]
MNVAKKFAYVVIGSTILFSFSKPALSQTAAAPTPALSKAKPTVPLDEEAKGEGATVTCPKGKHIAIWEAKDGSGGGWTCK